MIKRRIFDSLVAHLENKGITLLTGPRQSGKTTLLLLLRDYLIKSDQKTIFLNLDMTNDRNYFSSQMDLVRKIKSEFGNKRGFVFIDEIQRKENAGVFLKGIYDMNLPYKFIVSGSGSIELKEKIHESLAGRKRIFKLSTLSFEEFVNYKTEYEYEDRLQEYLRINEDERKGFLEEYLKFGGYPKVVLADTLDNKRLEIEEIYQSYLLKDISFLLKVVNIDAFAKLIKLLAGQIGRLVNYSEISNTLDISALTLKNYLWYLENTFVIEKVYPFFGNVRKEITKSPVYYFNDLGMRNLALDIFGKEVNEGIGDEGFLFQNFVYFLLKPRPTSPERIRFWRTKDGAEVDFVRDIGPKIGAFEVKYSNIKNVKITRSLRSFIEKYKPPKAFIINLSLEKSMKVGDTVVGALPFFKLSKVIES
ncbi:ATPase [Candidatus Woesebacteria bacterium CG22_combo_CG10-13_8_21_14_all_39_10]|uniref:ATPase n=1 Tax=Candidatus Woesebacteria bacterium CG22_combo_CG10-13_8_21_14_all_39_10 TaxID=1975059 RepID=A0A2H0BJA7_9BACT|nr:MAG: ATPase [Candidatus Woesebacteria bacterium CG22_combo_CG10-13_8_21_14_all_39_10]